MSQCLSYFAGHNTHWIPALNIYGDKPTEQVVLQPNGKGSFTAITTLKRGLIRKETLYFHNPVKLRQALSAVADASQVQRVRGTNFFKILSPTERRWFYLSNEPVSPCVYQ